MIIRKSHSPDRNKIHNLYLSTFPESEKEIVAKLAIDLLEQQSTLQTLTLVAEDNDNVIGHVAFSPVSIEGHRDTQGYILAPLAVLPGYQNQRTGTGLVEAGLEALRKRKVDIVFVYGDPGYYGRFGFSTEGAERFRPRYNLRFPHGWQALFLNRSVIDDFSVTIGCVSSLEDPRLW